MTGTIFKKEFVFIRSTLMYSIEGLAQKRPASTFGVVFQTDKLPYLVASVPYLTISIFLQTEKINVGVKYQYISFYKAFQILHIVKHRYLYFLKHLQINLNN